MCSADGGKSGALSDGSLQIPLQGLGARAAKEGARYSQGVQGGGALERQTGDPLATEPHIVTILVSWDSWRMGRDKPPMYGWGCRSRYEGWGYGGRTPQESQCSRL